MRRVLVVSAAMMGLVLLPVGGAFASGPPIANQTDHVVNETEAFTDVDPCTGAPAQITLTQSGVEHFTFFSDGTGHVTETLRGTFQFDYLDEQGKPDGIVDATGVFVEWDGFNGRFDEEGNPIGHAEETDTLNGRGTYVATGALFRFHNNGHILTDSAGNPKLDFFKAHCN